MVDIDTNPPAPDNNEPKGTFIDPVSLKAVGWTENDALNNGYKVRNMTLQESYDVNKDQLNGISFDQYKSIYNQAYAEQQVQASKNPKNINSLRTLNDATIADSKGAIFPVRPEVFGIDSQKLRAGWSLADGDQTQDQIGMMWKNGNLVQTMNAKAIAEARKTYYDPISNSMKSMDDYTMSTFSGNPFRVDENGNEYMLVLDTDSNTWVEKSANNVYAGDQLRTIYNSAKPEDSGVLEHMIDVSYNTMQEQLYSQWGTLAETAGTFGKWITGSDEVNGWQKWGRTLQNYGNARKSEISEAAEQDSFWSLRGFAGTTAQALTQVGTQLTIGRFTMGAANMLSALGQGGAVAAKIVEYAPMVFGSIYAGNAFNEEAKKAGINDEDRALLTAMAMGVVFASEKMVGNLIGSTGIVDGFRSKSSQQALIQKVGEKFSKLMDDFGPALSASSTPAIREAARNKIQTSLAATGNLVSSLVTGTQNLLKKPISLAYSQAPKSFAGRTGAAVATGWEEGWEEVFELQMNTFIKNAYNDGWIGKGPDEMSEPGKGLFQDTKWKVGIEDFIGGFIGGSFSGALVGGRLKRNFTDNLLAEAAFQYDSKDEFAKALAGTHQKGVHGSQLLTTDKQLIHSLPEDIRNKSKTINDAAYEKLVEEFGVVLDLKKKLNLSSPEVLSKMLNGDMSLAKDTLQNAVDAKKLQQEFEAKSMELQTMKPDDVRFAPLSKELEEIKTTLDTKNNLVRKALDGTMVQEYDSHMLARAMVVNRVGVSSMQDILEETDPELRKEKLSKLQTTMIEQGKKDDIWNNQEKALQLVDDVRKFNERYNNAVRTVEERKKESKGFLEQLNKNYGLNFEGIDFENNNDFEKFFNEITGKALRKSDFEQPLTQMRDRINSKVNALTNAFLQNFNLDEDDEYDIKDLMEEDEDGNTYYESSETTESDSAKEKRKDQKVKDEYYNILALQNRANNLNNRIGALDNDDAKSLVSYGSTTTDGYFTNQDTIKSNATPITEYFKLDKDNNRIDITEEEYAQQKALAKSDKDVFKSGDDTYTKQVLNKTKVTGKYVENGVDVESEEDKDFTAISEQMQDLFSSEFLIGDKEIQDVYLDLLQEFSSTKVVTPAMKEKMKMIKNVIEKRDSMLSMLNFVSELNKNKLLTDAQEKFFNYNSLKDNNSDIQALINKHFADIARYNFLEQTLISKDEREQKLRELRSNINYMFSQISDMMLKSFNLSDVTITVDGKTTVLKAIDVLPLDASETQIMQALQYWHYKIKTLNADERKEFVEQFRNFWGANFEKDQFPTSEYQGMFLDSFESMLNTDYFDKQSEIKDPKRTKHYKQLFAYHALNMIIHNDPYNVYNSFSQIFDSIPDVNSFDLAASKYKGDHTAEQILNLMIGFTHIEENKNRATATPDQLKFYDDIKTIMKLGTSLASTENAKSLYQPLQSGDKIVYQGKHIKDNFMLFTGGGGVGKTSFLIKSLIEYSILSGKDKFVLVAPNTKQLDAMKQAIPKGLENRFKTYVIEDFIPVQHEFQNSVVVLDEVSLYTQEQINTIYFNGEISSINNKKLVNLNPMPIQNSNTVFVLGDELQAPYSISQASSAPKMSVWMQHGFNMTAVKRSSYVDIFKLQNLFRLNAFNIKENIPVLDTMQYAVQGSKKYGVKLNSNEANFLQEAKEAVADNRGYIIVYDEKTYNELVADGVNQDRIYYMTNKSKSPQGLTIEDEVYVYMPYNKVINTPDMTNKFYNRYMLTATSRAANFVSVYTGNGLGNNNSSQVELTQLQKFEDNIDEVKARKKQLHDSVKEVKNGLQNIGADKKPLATKPSTNNTPATETTVTEKPVEEVTEKEDNIDDNKTVVDLKQTANDNAKDNASTEHTTNKEKDKAVVENDNVIIEDKELNNDLDKATSTNTHGVLLKDDNGINTIVTSSGYIISKGVTYTSDDKTYKVESITKDESGEYKITYSYMGKMYTIPQQTFENNTKKEFKEKLDNALFTFINFGMTEFFGQYYSDQLITDLKLEDRKTNYASKLVEQIKRIKNLPGRSSVNIKVTIPSKVIGYNGVAYDNTGYLLIVEDQDGNMLGSLHVKSNEKTTPADIYENLIYKLVKNKNLKDGEYLAEGILLNKKDILPKSYFGIDDKSTVKENFETFESRMSSYGFYVSNPVQIQAIDPITGNVIMGENGKAKVDTVVYVSTNETPNNDNGFPVFIESTAVNKMNDTQLENFVNYINNLANLKVDLTNESDVLTYLSNTDNFFYYNQNAFKLDNKTKNILFGDKVTAQEKAKTRNEILSRMQVELEQLAETSELNSLKVKPYYKDLRTPTKFTDFTSGKSVASVDNANIFSVKNYVYIKPPTIKLNNNSVFSINTAEGLESRKKDEHDLNVYDSSYNELQSELNQILGEGMELGMFRDSSTRHGFIDKFGNISLNFRGKQASSRALYHEVSHYVSEFLLTEEAQAKLFDEVSRKHPEFSNWRTNLKSRKGIAEALATMSERYASDRRNLKGISKYIQKFLDVLNRLLSNLGFIKNAINDFNYDVYVAKKYKTGKGDAMPKEREVMVFDELLSENKSYAVADIYKRFPNKEMAHDIIRSVGNVLASDLLGSSLNNRLFSQQEISFQDIINKVEYNTRSRVMFETDKYGRPKYEDGKLKLRPLKVVSKNELIDLFKYELNAKDSNGNIVPGESLMYFDSDTKKYVIAPYNAQGVYFSDSYSKNKIRKSLRDALSRHQIETANGSRLILSRDPQALNDFNSISNEEDKIFYKYAQTLDDVVIKAAINKYLPTLEVDNYLYNNKRFTYQEFVETINRAQDANIRKDSQEVNQMDSQSDIMKLIIASTPLFKYDITKDDFVKTPYVIPEIKANSLLINISQNLLNVGKESTLDNFKSALRNKIDSLKSKYNENVTEYDSEINILESFYRSYFEDSIYDPRNPNLSLYTLYSWNKAIMSAKSPDEKNTLINRFYKQYESFYNAQKDQGLLASNAQKLTVDKFAEGIKYRAKHAELVLNSLVSHFGSLNKEKYAISKKLGYNDSAYLSRRNLNTTNVDKKSDDISRKLDESLFEDNSGTIRTNIKNLFAFNEDKKHYSPIISRDSDDLQRANFIVNETGVRYFADPYSRQDQGVQMFSFDLNTGTFSFDYNAIATYATNNSKQKDLPFRMFFNHFFNIGSSESRSMVSALIQKRGSVSSVDDFNFANAVGPLVLSMYTFVAEKTYDADTVKALPNYEIYKSVLDKFVSLSNRGANYGKTNDANIEAYKANDIVVSKEGVEYYYPKEFYDQIEAIAKAMSGAAYNNTIRLGNKRIYTDSLNHKINYMFANGDLNFALAARNSFSNDNENHNLRKSNPILFPDQNYIPINPIYRTDRNFIAGKTFVSGIDNNGFIYELSDLSEADNAYLAMDHFLSNMQTDNNVSFAASSLIVQDDNHADRGRQMEANVYFNMFAKSANSNGIFTKVNGNLKLDYVSILNMLSHAHAMREEAQASSLNRWAKYLYSRTGNEIFNTKIYTTDANYKDLKNQLFNEINNTIQQSSFNIVNGEVVDFDGVNLTSGVDYIILVSDNTANLRLGYDTTMMGHVKYKGVTSDETFIKFTPNRISNYDNYEKIIRFNYGNKEQIFKIGDILSTFYKTGNLIFPLVDDKGNVRPINLSEIEADEAIEKVIVETLFADTFKTNAKSLKDNGYVMKSSNKLFNISNNVQGIEINGKVNEAWKGYLIAHHMYNYFLDNATQGTEAQELSNIIKLDGKSGSISYNANDNKRKATLSSTGKVAGFGSTYGLDKEGLIFPIADLNIQANIMSYTDNGGVSDVHTVFDGQDFYSPLHMLLYYNQNGANFGSTNISGGIKTINVNYDYNTGQARKNKHAADVFTDTLIKNSRDFARLFQISMNPAGMPIMPAAGIYQTIKNVSDLENINNNSLLQVYNVFLLESSLVNSVENTLDNIVKNHNSIESFIDKYVVGDKNTTFKSTWNNLTKDGFKLAQYEFLNQLFDYVDSNNSGISSKEMLADEGTPDHYTAMNMVVDFYAQQRLKYPDTYMDKYPFVSRFIFPSNEKQQAKQNYIPFAPYNKNAGASHTNSNGEYTQGREMPNYRTASGRIPTDLYSLYDMYAEEGIPVDYKKIGKYIDNTQEITQLNPNRAIDDNEESPMVQAISIIMAHPNSVMTGEAKQISDKLSELINHGLISLQRRLGSQKYTIEELNAALEESGNNFNLSELESKTIERFVKNKIKQSMRSSDDGTMLSTIINNEQIDINVGQGAITRITQYLSSFLKKEAVKRKTEAVRLAQMSGNFFDIYEEIETGEVYMADEAKKHAQKLGKNFNEIFSEVRGLKHSTLKQNENIQLSLEQESYLAGLETIKNSEISINLENTAEINKRYGALKTKYLIEQGLTLFERGEAIIPASKFKKYGIPPSIGLNQLFKLYNNEGGIKSSINLRQLVANKENYNQVVETVKELINKSLEVKVERRKNSKKPFISLSYNDNMTKGDNIYFDTLFIDAANEFFKNNSDITKVIENAKTNLLKSQDIIDAFNNGTIDNPEVYFNKLQEKIQEGIKEYLDSFIDENVKTYVQALSAVSLSINDNIGMRTPSGPGSGFINNIVGFVNDNGSVGYVNTIKNLIDGSDQDIDQFTMYYLADTLVDMGVLTEEEYKAWKTDKYNNKKFDEVDSEEGNRINNELLKILKNYYLNPLNTNFTMSPIDLSHIKKTAAEAYKKIFPFGDRSNDFSTSIKLRRLSMDGKTVGPFALAQKVQTLIFSAHNFNNGVGMNDGLFKFNITPDKYKNIPIYLEALINAATDNPKILALGALNTNISNADMLASMFFASDEIVEYMIRKTGNANITLYDAIFQFLKSNAHEDIFKFTNSNSVVDGVQRQRFYASAFNYQQSLAKNNLSFKNEAESLRKEMSRQVDIIRNKLSLLGYSDEYINEFMSTINPNQDIVESTKNYFTNKDLKNIKSDVKKKHGFLAKIITDQINHKVDLENNDDVKAYVSEKFDEIRMVAEYQELYKSIAPDKNVQVEQAAELSNQYKTNLSDLFSAVNAHRNASFKLKDLNKKLDPEYLEEVFLITKYAMLGDWMSNMTKMANINQFNISSPYDIHKFKRDVIFNTGYTLEQLLDIYDSYMYYQKSNNISIPISEYLELGEHRVLSTDEVAANAFNTRKHELATQKNNHLFDEFSFNDQAITYVNDYHKIGNAAQLLLSRSDIMESLRAVKLFETINDQMIISRSPAVVSFVEQFTDDAGYDILGEEKYNTLYDEINKYYIQQFIMNQDYNGYFKTAYRTALQRLGYDSMPLTGGINTGMMHGLDTTIGINNFVKQFPRFYQEVLAPRIAEELKDSMSEKTANFLENIEVQFRNGQEYLYVKKDQLISNVEKEDLRLGFKELPEHYKNLLSIYHILKEGFNYKNSFLGEVMPEEFLVDYSNFIKENLINEEGKYTVNSFLDNDTKNNILISILANDNFLNLLKKGEKHETTVKVGDKEITYRYELPPASANGTVKYYNKEIDRKPGKKGYRPKVIRGAVEVKSINGTSLAYGQATKETKNIIPFSSLFDFNATSNKQVTISDVSYEIPNISNGAYIKYFIHGHAQYEINNLFNATAKDLGRPLSNSEEAAIVLNYLSNTNFNVNYRYKKGIKLKTIENANEHESIDQQIKNQTLALIKENLVTTYGDNVLQRLLSLSGKTIIDRYNNGPLTPSKVFYAFINGVKLNTLDDFVNATEVPDIKTVAVPVNEGKPVVNIFGAHGLYFENDLNPIIQGSVVELQLPNSQLNTGTKDNFYALMHQARGITSDVTPENKQLYNEYIWNINLNKELGIANALPDINPLIIPQIEQSAFNNTYTHLDINIKQDVSNLHAKVLKDVREASDVNVKKEILTTNAFSIKMFSESIYQIGDNIVFNNGVKGYITNISGDKKTITYILNPASLDTANVYSPTMRSNFNSFGSLEDIVRKNNSKNTLDGLINIVSKSLPNIDYYIVNDEQAKQINRLDSDAMSFVQDGIIYINKDKADGGVVIHEFAHPLVYAISNTNPELFNLMAQEVAKTELPNYIKNRYPELVTDEQIMMEAIPTYIQMRYYARDRANLSLEQQAIWDNFFSEIKQMLKDGFISDVDYASTIDMLDLKHANLNAISDAIINDLTKGLPLSEITSNDLSKMVPYVMRSSTSSKLKNININNLNQVFQKRADYSEETAIKNRIRESLNGVTYEGFLNTYDLTMNNPAFYDDANNYSDALRNQYIDQLLNQEYEFYEGLDNKFIDFLNKTKSSTFLDAAKTSMYSVWSKRKNLSEASESQLNTYEVELSNMVSRIGFNPVTDEAYTLEEGFKKLGLDMPINLRNRDTIMLIHNAQTADQQISIISLTAKGLYDYGFEESKLGAAYFPDSITKLDAVNSELSAVKLNNSNANINAIKNTIISMAIKKQAPQTVIRKVGSARVTSYMLDPNMRDIKDIIPQLDIILNTLPQLKENLERDLYDVISDRSLYNIENYNRPLLDRLHDYFSSLYQNSKNEKYKTLLEHQLTNIDAIRNSFTFDKYGEIQNAVANRLGFIKSNVPDVSIDEEYQYLADLYRELTGYNEIGTKKVNALTFTDKIYGTADRWDGQIRTWVFDQIDLASRRSVQEFFPLQKQIDNAYKKLDEAMGGITSLYTDASHDLCKPMFKTFQGLDENGNTININLHEIHWNENDVDTAKLLKSGELTIEQLRFGKLVADAMFDEFVKYVMTVDRANLISKIGEDPDALYDAAVIEVNRRYRKGMMPVFTRTAGSALHDGEYKEAFDKYMGTARSFAAGNIFDEYQQSDVSSLQQDEFNKITSPFWSQFNSSDLYGSLERLKMLGVDVQTINGQTVLKVMNQDRHDSVSYNLQNISNFTLLASTRARNMQQAVASANIAMDMLRGEEALRGANTAEIRDHLSNYINRQVYGNMPTTGRELLGNMSIKLDNLFDGTGKLIVMMHLAVNFKSGVKNATAAGLKLILNSVTNSLSYNKGFDIPSVTKAVTEMFTNPDKVEALNKKYQFVNVNERDMINHWSYVSSRKNITEQDFQMIIHWIGDHYTQLIGAMAQMIKEGTYDAHDNTGTYNSKLDKRFYNNDGTLTEDADIKMRGLAEQQYKEGYNLPDENGNLTSAYAQRDENRVKVFVQRFVGELNDNKFKNYMSSYGLGRAAMTLKSYVYNVAQAWWNNPKDSVQLGNWEVYENYTGNKSLGWKPEVTEGILQTLFYSINGLKKAAKGDASDLKNMSSYQKRNLTNMAVFTGAVMAAYLLADALLAGEDDDDKKKRKYTYTTDPKTGKRKRVYGNQEDPEWIGARLLSMMYDTRYTIPEDRKDNLKYSEQLLKYVLMGAVDEQLSYVSPLRPIQDIFDSRVPHPYKMQFDNVTNLFKTTLAMPWSIQEEGMMKATDKLAVDVSKNTPLVGSSYRFFRDGIEAIFNQLDNTEKQ